MFIKIVVPGVYNDNHLEAHTCNEGDVLETRGWYGQELIKQGLAEEFIPVVEETIVEETKAPAGKKPAGGNKRQTKNAFVN
ncbi:MAG TPA: hypothetical protein VFF78_03860 [Anaerolineaceae bacterium]|nr:hypothetical protein [Anaerolineaceae bacterium]